MTTKQEVYEIVKAMPGLTAREIHSLTPGRTYSAVTQALYLGMQSGVLLREWKPNPEKRIKRGPYRNQVSAYSINPNPVKRKLRLVEPTEAGLKATVEEMKARIADLEEWKTNAIARFPDLAVEPAVLAARKIVAAQLEDKAEAGHVLAGRRDGMLPMRVALAALDMAA